MQLKTIRQVPTLDVQLAHTRVPQQASTAMLEKSAGRKSMNDRIGLWPPKENDKLFGRTHLYYTCRSRAETPAGLGMIAYRHRLNFETLTPTIVIAQKEIAKTSPSIAGSHYEAHYFDCKFRTRTEVLYNPLMIHVPQKPKNSVRTTP